MANKQSQAQSQNQIQDQHYSNGIFYTVMSTLQSLLQVVLNESPSQYGHKMFRSYDKFDYKGKNLQTLKSQLQTHLMAFNYIMILFRKEYPGQWRLPQNFNIERSELFIIRAINIFQRKNQKECSKLAGDILTILLGKKQKLYFQQKDFTPILSPGEQQKARVNLFSNSIHAQQQMYARQNEIRNFTNVSQLRAEINQDSWLFRQILEYQSKNNGQNVGNQNEIDSKQVLQRYYQNLKMIQLNLIKLKNVYWNRKYNNRPFKNQEQDLKKQLKNRIKEAQTQKKFILQNDLQCPGISYCQKILGDEIKRFLNQEAQKKEDIKSMISLLEKILYPYEEKMIQESQLSQTNKQGGMPQQNKNISNQNRKKEEEKNQNQGCNQNNTNPINQKNGQGNRHK